MSADTSFDIKRFQFSGTVFDELETFPRVKDFWPMVYILSGDSDTQNKKAQAYVGETTDAFTRMWAHLAHDEKKQLESLHLIGSDKFNKSATLDIEANLIRYMSGDGVYKLLNGNIGLANHNYYQKKEVYWKVFERIWQQLIAEGIAKKSLESINNSDLFKYSPYKSLMPDQKQGVLNILQALAQGGHQRFVVKGGAGTGKTIIAIYLCKLLCSEQEAFAYSEFGEEELKLYELVNKVKARFGKMKIGLMVPMASFRGTLKKVFRHVKDLKPSMVIGPSDITRERYDLILVDEAHRLRRRVNLGLYFGAFDKSAARLGLDPKDSDELDWVLAQSQSSILFYDPEQSIKPSDTPAARFGELMAGPATQTLELISQFRVRGGIGYARFIDQLLRDGDELQHPFHSHRYDLKLFGSFASFVAAIKEKDKEYELSRMVAGMSWKWPSKDDKTKFDIEIEGVQLQWNHVSIDWINSPGSIDQVGCIHTTQGYDLNYTGVIFGNETRYNPEQHCFEIDASRYDDPNGKQSIDDPAVLKQYIINIYKTVLMRGIRGTYVYACDANLREYLSRYIPGMEALPEIVISHLEAPDRVPLFPMHAAAGDFSGEQQAGTHEWVELPAHIRFDKDLFALKVTGESMNLVIPNGSICLFRKYSGGSRDGRIVLVELIDRQDPETGSRFTVKEYRSIKSISEEGWDHESIKLVPRSANDHYKEIQISREDASNLKVIADFVAVLSP